MKAECLPWPIRNDCIDPRGIVEEQVFSRGAREVDISGQIPMQAEWIDDDNAVIAVARQVAQLAKVKQTRVGAVYEMHIGKVAAPKILEAEC